MDKRKGEENQDFFLEIFCLKVRKNFAGNLSVLCFRIFGSEKCYGYERVDIKIFRTIFLVSQCGKGHFVGESLSVPLFLGFEKVCG